MAESKTAMDKFGWPVLVGVVGTVLQLVIAGAAGRLTALPLETALGVVLFGSLPLWGGVVAWVLVVAGIDETAKGKSATAEYIGAALAGIFGFVSIEWAWPFWAYLWNGTLPTS